MSGGVLTRLHAQYLPQGKEKLLLRDILRLKRRSCLLPAGRTLLRLNRTKQTLWWNHQANKLQLPPSLKPGESIEPNYTNLEVDAIGYTFSKMF